jgi:hypothetical protein
MRIIAGKQLVESLSTSRSKNVLTAAARGSVRTQNTTEKAHSKWGNHCQNEQRMREMRALCRLFVASVGIHSFSHHTVS